MKAVLFSMLAVAFSAFAQSDNVPLTKPREFFMGINDPVIDKFLTNCIEASRTNNPTKSKALCHQTCDAQTNALKRAISACGDECKQRTEMETAIKHIATVSKYCDFYEDP